MKKRANSQHRHTEYVQIQWGVKRFIPQLDLRKLKLMTRRLKAAASPCES